jgi:hypothetical protein
MTRLALVVACALALTGCHDFRDDLLIICDSPDKVKDKFPENAKSAAKLAIIGEYIWEEVKTKDGKALIIFLSTADRTKRGKVLRDLSQQYGIPACRFAEFQ